MKKILSIFIMGLLVFTFSVQITRAETFNPVSVTVTSYFDTTNEVNNEATGNTYGTILKLQNNLATKTGYSFAYWAINDVLAPELPIDNDFDVTNDMEIQAYYSKDGEHLVLFVDSNGNVLKHQYVLNAGSAVAPATLPDKPGMSIATPAWDNDLTNITQNTILVLQYENDTSHSAADLSVIASSLTDANITGSGDYSFNTQITLTAPLNANTIGETPRLVQFAYWEDTSENIIVSYNTNYTFSVFSNRVFEAVYYDLNVPAMDTIVITDVIDLRTGYNTIISQFEVLDGSYALEYGIITHDEYIDFNLNTEGVTRFQADKINGSTKEFVLSIPEMDSVSRAYLVIRDESNSISVVYSDLYNFVMIETIYPITNKNLDFEDATSTEWEFWTPDTILPTYDTIITRDTQALKFISGSAWVGIGFDGPDYPARGDTVKLGFWIYVDSTTASSVGGFTIKLLEKEGPGGDVERILYTTTHESFNMDEWVYLETTTGTISFFLNYIQIVIEEGTDGTVYVDDVTIIKVVE